MNINTDNNLKDDIREDLSVKEIYYIILANYKKLILSILSFLLIMVVYLIIVKPTFISTAKIIVESEDSTMNSLFDMDLGGSKNFLENEIRVLESRTTAERTIQSLYESEDKNNLFLFNTKKYERNFLSYFLSKMLFLDRQEIFYFNDNEQLSDSLFKTFVKELRLNIEVVNLRNTDILTISYPSNSESESALIVNTLINEYVKRDREWASGEMSHLKIFLRDQLRIKEIELDKVEQDFKVFQQQEHIYGLDNNSNLLLNQLTSIESDYYNTEAKKNIQLERKKYFQQQLSQNEKDFAKRVTNTIDVQMHSIRMELSSLEAEFISTKAREGIDHPAVKKLKNKIVNLKEVLKNETNKFIKQGIAVANPIEYRQAIMDSVINLDVYISGYNSKLEETSKLIEKYESELSLLPEKYLEFSRLQRDKVILTETYILMKQKLEEAKITEASQLGKIRLIDPAITPLQKSAPATTILLIIALIFGFFFGIVIILLSEFLDYTVKSIEEIERRGLSVLAIIPSIGTIDDSTKKKKKGYKINLKLTNSDKIERRLLTHENPKSPISEAYRTLRTSLMYDNDDRKCKIMLVSSSGPGEGKTTTVANLAITYANMGKRTLLIDADLRKPVIHKMFTTELNAGLTNYLSKNEKRLDKIYYKSGIENLYIVKSGAIPPNPSELLSSDSMKNFIEDAKKEFDIVLIDTPPMIAVTDAFIINKHVDKTLLVIRASVTQKGALERTLVNMNNMSGYFDGVIFNGVNETNSYGGGYYYNYYQYYYGDAEK